MKNKIKVVPWCRMYSIIEVNKNEVITKHIINNTACCGGKDLKAWVEYFENEF